MASIGGDSSDDEFPEAISTRSARSAAQRREADEAAASTRSRQQQRERRRLAAESQAKQKQAALERRAATRPSSTTSKRRRGSDADADATADADADADADAEALKRQRRRDKKAKRARGAPADNAMLSADVLASLADRLDDDDNDNDNDNDNDSDGDHGHDEHARTAPLYTRPARLLAADVAPKHVRNFEVRVDRGERVAQSHVLSSRLLSTRAATTPAQRKRAGHSDHVNRKVLQFERRRNAGLSRAGASSYRASKPLVGRPAARFART